MKEAVFSLFSLASWLLFVGVSSQAQCGSEVGGALCPGGLCCSQWGYCGGTIDYCGQGCQSQCGSTPPPPPPTPVPTPPTPTPSPPTPPSPGGGDDVSSLISESLFNEFLKHRSTPPCPGGFYTYTGFITATRSFDGFGTTGNIETRKRELAAFFGQTSHETTGGWETAEDGPYAWGYCFIQEVGNPGEYCQPSLEWPCVPGQKYYGRGPMQLSWNYNYGQAGQALGLDLLNNPDLLVTDPVIAFKAALWFWMTPQAPKPSSHDVITRLWTPSPTDIAAGRLPGYGVITNIINGGLECGIANDPRVESRIGFYTRYCGLLGVSLGENLDCANQSPFGYSLSASF